MGNPDSNLFLKIALTMLHSYGPTAPTVGMLCLLRSSLNNLKVCGDLQPIGFADLRRGSLQNEQRGDA
jgi:hypothetical protein